MTCKARPGCCTHSISKHIDTRCPLQARPGLVSASADGTLRLWSSSWACLRVCSAGQAPGPGLGPGLAAEHTEGDAARHAAAALCVAASQEHATAGAH